MSEHVCKKSSVPDLEEDLFSKIAFVKCDTEGNNKNGFENKQPLVSEAIMTDTLEEISGEADETNDKSNDPFSEESRNLKMIASTVMSHDLFDNSNDKEENLSGIEATLKSLEYDMSRRPENILPKTISTAETETGNVPSIFDLLRENANGCDTSKVKETCQPSNEPENLDIVTSEFKDLPPTTKSNNTDTKCPDSSAKLCHTKSADEHSSAKTTIENSVVYERQSYSSENIVNKSKDSIRNNTSGNCENIIPLLDTECKATNGMIPMRTKNLDKLQNSDIYMNQVITDSTNSVETGQNIKPLTLLEHFSKADQGNSEELSVVSEEPVDSSTLYIYDESVMENEDEVNETDPLNNDQGESLPNFTEGSDCPSQTSFESLPDQQVTEVIDNEDAVVLQLSPSSSSYTVRRTSAVKPNRSQKFAEKFKSMDRADTDTIKLKPCHVELGRVRVSEDHSVIYAKPNISTLKRKLENMMLESQFEEEKTIKEIRRMHEEKSRAYGNILKEIHRLKIKVKSIK